MKVGDLVRQYGTNPPLIGVVVAFGYNGKHKTAEEMVTWNPNPDVHIVGPLGKFMLRMHTLEIVSESR